MTKTHKEILQEANAAIARGDFEGFLVHCTEDTVWNFLGERTLRGKAVVRRWMAEAYRQPPRFNVRQLIADGEFLAAVGEITLKDDSGKDATFSYCDVWRFQNNRMAELNAFVVAPPLNATSSLLMPPMTELVSLRPVVADDLPIFFLHQLDAEAARLAAFPSRDREAFMLHWTTRILGNPAAVSHAILCENAVVGNIGAWTDADTHERLLGYWIGREFWGRGIASAAVAQLLRSESTRPLTAHVAKHNLGSIRVLEKNGFTRAGEDRFTLPDGTPVEEFIYRLPG